MAQFYLPLPVELIREIIIDVMDVSPRKTVATLALVSKTFHSLVMPILYHNLHIMSEDEASSLIRCIKFAHASSMDNAKYIAGLFFELEAMRYFDDFMSLPGLNPQSLFFETSFRFPTNDDEKVRASSWEVRPKFMGLTKYSSLSHKVTWVSHLTHLYLEDVLGEDALSFCLEIRTLTHICFPIRRDMDNKDALGQIHRLLGMPSMEQVLICAMLDEVQEYSDTWRDGLNAMGFPKGNLFPLLADSIPDERLYVCPEADIYPWALVKGVTPWDLGRRLTMPWRKGVKVA